MQTGDSSNLFVYAGTLLLAAAAFVFGFRRRNQEK
ncbi:MAG: LPXTG cell wall anchor domain-containing protein [[Ruminococcus] torques]